MAYIKERGENTYLVRITIGTDGHGKPIQKSRTFHPSKPNLPKTKLKKELDAFVEAFENEFQIETVSPLSEVLVAEVLPSSQQMISSALRVMPYIPQKQFVPTFAEFCVEYKRVKQKMLSPTSWELYEKALDK